MSRKDGYRYVRQYWVQCHTVSRWALWEVQGGRARRVGTAWHEGQVREFLAQNDTRPRTLTLPTRVDVDDGDCQRSDPLD